MTWLISYKALLMVGKLVEDTDHDSQTILKHYKVYQFFYCHVKSLQ